MSFWLSGIGVSRGIAIGRVSKITDGDLEVREYSINAGAVEQEVTRYLDAHNRAKTQLSEVRAQIPPGTPQDIAAFIDTHLLMLDDRSLTDAVIATIRSDTINAEAALARSRDALVAVFEQMDDPYLRTRQNDIEHVVARILRVLLRSGRAFPGDIRDSDEPAVMVADDITPADIILLAQQKTAAFVTEYGGPLSHTAILARSLGIPAIVGVHGARRLLRKRTRTITGGRLEP